MFCYFYQPEDVFQTFSEGNLLAVECGFLVLEEGDVQEEDDEMSEEDYLVLVMQLKIVLQVYFLYADGWGCFGPLVPVQLYLFELFEGKVPLDILVVVLLQKLLVLLDKFQFCFIGHFHIKLSFMAREETSVQFGEGEPMVGDLHLFDNFPQPLNIQPVENLPAGAGDESFIVSSQLRIFPQQQIEYTVIDKLSIDVNYFPVSILCWLVVVNNGFMKFRQFELAFRIFGDGFIVCEMLEMSVTELVCYCA